MHDWLLDLLQYYGAAAGTLAALLVSLNLGRLWTGWAMVIFVTSSLALILWGFLQPDSAGIGWQNVALLAINCLGVWRYLIRRRGVERPTADTHRSVSRAASSSPSPARHVLARSGQAIGENRQQCR